MCQILYVHVQLPPDFIFRSETAPEALWQLTIVVVVVPATSVAPDCRIPLLLVEIYNYERLPTWVLGSALQHDVGTEHAWVA